MVVQINWNKAPRALCKLITTLIIGLLSLKYFLVEMDWLAKWPQRSWDIPTHVGDSSLRFSWQEIENKGILSHRNCVSWDTQWSFILPAFIYLWPELIRTQESSSWGHRGCNSYQVHTGGNQGWIEGADKMFCDWIFRWKKPLYNISWCPGKMTSFVAGFSLPS